MTTIKIQEFLDHALEVVEVEFFLENCTATLVGLGKEEADAFFDVDHAGSPK